MHTKKALTFCKCQSIAPHTYRLTLRCFPVLRIFGNPAIHALDPWLCVAGSLRLCPERKFSLYHRHLLTSFYGATRTGSIRKLRMKTRTRNLLPVHRTTGYPRISHEPDLAITPWHSKPYAKFSSIIQLLKNSLVRQAIMKTVFFCVFYLMI
jgi:hypothetical protein